ncbi:aminodeoxychorismate synthase, subunit I [Muriicola jejuensis]|uniref:Aminodeoxychorismate synthase component I n=1 Tax=Muriicola jejuensis TaxID=504488 RepID=A0A6P0UAQ8_9FLAO|nr:aminodeoxychorismate synthase component I [Muriicola jejuensis]NER10381.1 aminodeoxychorismate synthase component I [Muriicola jejuensis]SMP00992.1 aminodeoxychorismate synthase, subunit I [Muriicola jejuensis]
MEKTPIQHTINDWGRRGIPFLFIIDFEQEKPLAWPLSQVPQNVLYNFNGKTNSSRIRQPLPEVPYFVKNPVSLEEYRTKFDAVIGALKQGNSYLLNLTTSTYVETNLELSTIFSNANSKYAVCIEDQFVSFSPETFVKIQGNYLYTYPMKGTINADLPEAQHRIMSDRKEEAEHATIVDLMRNDLSRVGREVTLVKYRYYEVLNVQGKKIGQVSSEIRAKLPQDFASNLGDILYSLLPAGSISGAPKQKTVELIRSIEAEPRGYYTGVAFYFDGKSLDSCVLIRFLEKNGQFRSGGGITAQSVLESEYQEMIDKVYVPFY